MTETSCCLHCSCRHVEYDHISEENTLHCNFQLLCRLFSDKLINWSVEGQKIFSSQSTQVQGDIFKSLVLLVQNPR